MSKSLAGTKTLECLKHAFAGESQANRRYLYFARKADIEGYPDIANILGKPLRVKLDTPSDTLNSW